jgi:hypothetical protein
MDVAIGRPAELGSYIAAIAAPALDRTGGAAVNKYMCFFHAVQKHIYTYNAHLTN